jgi:hypothetical protein
MRRKFDRFWHINGTPTAAPWDGNLAYSHYHSIVRPYYDEDLITSFGVDGKKCGELELEIYCGFIFSEMLHRNRQSAHLMMSFSIAVVKNRFFFPDLDACPSSLKLIITDYVWCRRSEDKL